MNEDMSQEILVEFRRLRRTNELACWVAIGMVLVCAALITWKIYHPSTRARAAQTGGETPWTHIENAIDRGDFQSALAAAQWMTNRVPQYSYAYSSLGHVHLAMGDLANAEVQFARAVELFPSEDNEKVLATIRKRLARERGTHAAPK